MSESADPATPLSGLFERIRAGNREARNQLLAALYNRILRLTAVILRDFSIVQQRRTVESLANDLVLKLIVALNSGLRTQNTAEFLRLAGLRLRQMLIDEAEKIRRQLAPAKQPPPMEGEAVVIQPEADQSGAGAIDRTAPKSLDPAELAQWTEFHERVGQLPEDERQVVEMHFYLETPQAEIALVLGCGPKAVSRLWLAALEKIEPWMPEVK